MQICMNLIEKRYENEATVDFKNWCENEAKNDAKNAIILVCANVLNIFKLN